MLAAPMTELEAVNDMLIGIGQLPVNAIIPEIVDQSIALGELNKVVREVCLYGFKFNTDEDFVLSPDIDGFIAVPTGALDIDPMDKAQDIIVRKHPSKGFGPLGRREPDVGDGPAGQGPRQVVVHVRRPAGGRPWLRRHRRRSQVHRSGCGRPSRRPLRRRGSATRLADAATPAVRLGRHQHLPRQQGSFCISEPARPGLEVR